MSKSFCVITYSVHSSPTFCTFLLFLEENFFRNHLIDCWQLIWRFFSCHTFVFFDILAFFQKNNILFLILAERTLSFANNLVVPAEKYIGGGNKDKIKSQFVLRWESICPWRSVGQWVSVVIVSDFRDSFRIYRASSMFCSISLSPL